MIEEYTPSTGEEDAEQAIEALEDGWISPRGSNTADLEDQMADRLGVDHAFAVDSGTAALHLALLAADLPEGGEVIVPDFTYGATALAVSQAGLRPVFADIDRDHLGITADAVREAMTPDTAAVLPAHLMGMFPDPGPLQELAEDHGLALIEDAAQSLGAHRDGTHAGTAGDLGCLSFSWNKPMTTGKGGMVVTGDDGLAGRIEQLADYGIEPGSRYELGEVGYNYRMDSIRAGIGLAQLGKIDAVIEGRQRVAEQYRERLDGIVDGKPSPQAEKSPVQWYFFAEDAETVVAELRERNIGARPFYPPVHAMPLYDRSGSYPETEYVSHHGVALPTSPEMTEDDVETVAEAVKDVTV